VELDLHWWVRFAHVGAATVVLGGALLATMVVLQAASEQARDDTARAIAEGYEWLFWIAAPVLIATGIGNLGALGLGLPAPGSRWGITLVTKLLLFLGLLLWSARRTLVVVRTLEGAARPSRRAWTTQYAVSTGLGLAILGYAEALAHG
jgi:putative copper export protein